MMTKYSKISGGIRAGVLSGLAALLIGSSFADGEAARTAEMTTGPGAISAAAQGNKKTALGLSILNFWSKTRADRQEHEETIRKLNEIQQSIQNQNNPAYSPIPGAEKKPEFFACNYWEDSNNDGKLDRYREMVGECSVFCEDETISFYGAVAKKPYRYEILNGQGQVIFKEESKNKEKNDFANCTYSPKRLSLGNYTAVWYTDGKLAGKNQIVVLGREENNESQNTTTTRNGTTGQRKMLIGIPIKE